MNLLTFIKNFAIALLTQSFDNKHDDSSDYEIDTDTFSNNLTNSYRFNKDGDIVTDLEGKNELKNGGFWVRKE